MLSEYCFTNTQRNLSGRFNTLCLLSLRQRTQHRNEVSLPELVVVTAANLQQGLNHWTITDF